MSRISKHDALLATAAYADIFDYSLTRKEIVQWFLYYPVSMNDITKGVGVRMTHKNASWQQRKWEIVQKAGRWLSLVPSIQLVGVTGGLAMNNAEREDDIDLFFIVADGTIWVSRFLATILMDILGLRRHPEDTLVANKVCLNMFMTHCATGLAPADRDCFTAHEVLQMVPIWEQTGTYQRFLQTNQWVKIYLPNAWKEKNAVSVPEMYTSIPVVIMILRIVEWPVKQIQLWYMKRHRTQEVISDSVLRFHPRDARIWIKRSFAARLAHNRIPLDKVFYAR